MKAKLPQKIKLSIGLIVKNEEKHIRNCLEALQPLMAEVPSELIIADTGSTDSTLEIAKEYTDQAFSYEWENDFAAARNSTVDRARGEWYMFVDADEYLCDPSEMIRFFNGAEQKKYNLATYVVRSYSDEEKNGFSDFRGVRCCRNHIGNRFSGTIHEALSIMPPVKHLETRVDHYGYVYKSIEDVDRKRKRNMDLMLQEYKNSPNNPRLLVLMYDSAPFDDKEKYLLEALEVVRNDKKSDYYGSVYLRMMNWRMGKKEHETAVETGEEYFREKITKACSVDLDMYALMGMAYYNIDRITESMEAFDHYFDFYSLYKQDKLDTGDMIYTQIIYIQTKNHIEIVRRAANIYCEQQEYNKALETIEKLDYEDLTTEQVKALLNCLYPLIEETGQLRFLAVLYDAIRPLKDTDKMKEYLSFAGKYYYQHDIQRWMIANEFHYVDKRWKDDQFISLMTLLASEGSDKFTENLDGYIDTAKEWGAGFSEGLYLLLKYKKDIFFRIDGLSSADYSDMIELLAYYHTGEFAGVAADYCINQDINRESLRTLFLCISLESQAMADAENIEKETRKSLYQQFSRDLAEYTTRLYNKEVLESLDIDIVPDLYKFGYYMWRAYQAFDHGDQIGYIKGLRAALKQCPEMKKVIMCLLSDIEGQEANRNADNEFEIYAAEVKKRIIQIAEKGMIEEARMLADQYLKLKPHDMEVEEILNRNQFSVESQSYIMS